MTSKETDQQIPSQAQPAAVSEADPTISFITENKPSQLADESEEGGAAEITLKSPDTLPGELLAARRNELNMTLEQVSQRLKLAPRQIAALEANDFASLPGMAIVRGFIRSYAKLLELDPVHLLSMMDGEANPATDPIVLRRPLPSRGFPGRRYSPPDRHHRGSRRLSGLALLVMVFVGVLVYVAYRHDVVDTNRIKIPAVGSLFSLSLNKGADNQQRRNAAQPTAESAVESAAEVIAEPKPIDPSRLLELRFREDAWVEISAINGNKLVSRLMRAGTMEQFDMKEPVVLVIGNASGVDANLRGQPLNLRAVARDNVSKLSLK